jgi:hypothetical protein
MVLGQDLTENAFGPFLPADIDVVRIGVAIASLRLAYSSIRSCIAAFANHAKATGFRGRCERVAPFQSLSLTTRGASRDSRR